MAGFWEWRGKPKSAPPPVASKPATLEPVELYTATAMVHGYVDAAGRRLSDILNANSHLAIRDPKSTSILASVEGAEGEGWASIPSEDILLTMPPEYVSPRQLRVHRRQHRVRITTGPYQLVGNAHLPPGSELHSYALQRRLKFLAVTDAWAYSTVDSAFQRKAPVVLVNVGPIEELTEVLKIS
ncbi:MAG TPA: hypothetical protein VH475_02875 [Tepidisphaeraceae bacterium]|jgi:hypothetical protein